MYMKMATASAAQIRITKQIRPIKAKEPDSIICAKVPLGEDTSKDGCDVTAANGIGVLVAG